jgi:hypothetical protein
LTSEEVREIKRLLWQALGVSLPLTIWANGVAAMAALLVGWFCKELIKRHPHLKFVGAFLGILTVAVWAAALFKILHSSEGSDTDLQGPRRPPVVNQVTAPPAPTGSRQQASEHSRAAVPNQPAASEQTDRPSQSTSTRLRALGGRSSQALVLVTDERGEWDLEATTLLATDVQGNGGAFLRTFTSTGAFQRCFDGDRRDLESIKGINETSLVMLARRATALSRGAPLAPDLIKADVTIDLRTYRPNRDFETQFIRATAQVAGFSEQQARANGLDRAMTELLAKVNSGR